MSYKDGGNFWTGKKIYRPDPSILSDQAKNHKVDLRKHLPQKGNSSGSVAIEDG
jgi:hypothetical protein